MLILKLALFCVLINQLIILCCNITETDFLRFLTQHYVSKTILHSVAAAVEVKNNKIAHSESSRLGPDKFVALKIEINRLLEAGIIEPSHLEFSSPIV